MSKHGTAIATKKDVGAK